MPRLLNKTSVRMASMLITLCWCAIMSGCSAGNQYPDAVTRVLDAAGDNRAELESVLIHYSQPADTLKLKAAEHLIGNMAEHSYVTYYMHDTTGAEIAFDVRDYADYDNLTAAADSIESERGELDFDKHDPELDMHTITAEFLITQIDYAFRAWQEKPWAKQMSWEDFRDYVLPYRGSNEPLQPWRETFYQKYQHVAADMTDPSDPIEAAVVINKDIMTWFGFDPRYYYHPTDQGLSEMIESGLGRCEDMTNVTIYAMRANGIGVTSDYTPYWANTGNNHAWNAIVTPSGDVIPFMGAEAQPGQYRLANRLAKVYRKTFSEQKENLAFQPNKQEEVPRWLGRKYFRDVTDEYVATCDIEITLGRDVPDSVDIAYLCVFNSGDWQAIHWGRIENNIVTFTSMGKEIAYLPALYLDEKIVPFGAPFVLGDDCSQDVLDSKSSESQSIALTSVTKRKLVASTDGITKSFLTDGGEYEMFVWRDDWQSLGQKTANGGPLIFDDVPSGGLYWLRRVDSDREERIFTMENHRQIWW